ncbi:MAG TPA: tannase/feruloyl esterase family alpha/beta hydrolase [Gammaproteobacteria bacterium]
MRTQQKTTVSCAVGAAALLGASGALGATACEDLTGLELPDTRITLAERVPAGTFTPPGPTQGPGAGRALEVPAMCRVAGVVSPAIRFEVWLPEGERWNGRFQAVGGGGLAGIISYPAMAEAVRAGYASASTDTGHEAGDTAWLSDRQRVIDYGYRAIHEMTVKAKAVIEAHYGNGPEYSYFNGCSTGGRQGLMEAQRFPEDYDGIVSGAPVNTFTHLHIGQLWTAHATLKTPGAVLTRDDLTLVSNAVLEACDADDGVKDGILTDPRTCDFDPSVLACQSGRTEQCLAPQQIDALEKIYQGAVNPRTGVQIYPGLEPGSEGPQPNNPGWALIMNGREPFAIDVAVIGGMTFENPNWDWRTFDFDSDVELVDAKLYGVLNAVDPDLRDFKARGGKLIIYHGWNDPGVMPRQTIHYYDNVVEHAAKATGGDGKAFTDEYLRLFMMPGVGHCRGGAGPDRADFMAAIAGWVEEGKAPERIVASKEQDGKVVMTRPLCPHPQVARYRGRGDPNDERNFECAAPE